MCEKNVIVGCLLLLLNLVLVPSAQADEILLLQEDSYLPYMGVADFEAIGIYSDILDEAQQRLNPSSFALKAVPWSRAIELVRAGNAQGLVGTYYRPAARPWIRTFSVPLFTEQVGVFCRPGIGDESWSYPEDFKGLIFGNNTNFRTPGARFFELVDAGEITLLEAETTAMNLKMLEIGRLDCYVQEQLTTEREIRGNKLKNVRRVKTISAETAHIGYSASWMRPEADAFIAEMDRVLTDMHSDGAVNRIIAAYLSSS
ncbi:substrate-binding periplasmic protein [Roseibium sediminicola]|uniref:Transporter substrate-binding domain-containing protein n=1 Tax=Roseibium sediminicola TaxID=2933272 RepID=A0ABT0H266_9HYPH|nr:transporter substrate-binding domain-containing protein [Roseibium sp. CAU 1639]MCK7615783.1 transporter substrate-binding domain-containing protein [Roseibium sp. CAU 1639]